MNGIYRIREDKITLMKAGSRAVFAKGLLGIYVILVMCALFGKETEDRLETVFWLTIFFTGMFVLAMVFSLFVKSEIYNTVIEITDDRVTRNGEDLLTIELRYTDIGSIIRKDNGTILLKRGLAGRINLYTNKRAYLSEPGILFIPLAIDNYEKIVSYIRQQVK